MLNNVSSRRELLASVGLGLWFSQFGWGEELDISTAEISEKWIEDWRDLARAGEVFEHWTPEAEGEWKWYRLERFVEEQWKTVGITLPLHRETGEPFDPAEGYLAIERIPAYVIDESLPTLPESVRVGLSPSMYSEQSAGEHVADSGIRSRHGKPPSDWLLSLRAHELRQWLPSVDAPQASVRGMTFWVHLVRDHGFDPRRIEGLSEEEFKLLHSVAHEGY